MFQPIVQNGVLHMAIGIGISFTLNMALWLVCHYCHGNSQLPNRAFPSAFKARAWCNATLNRLIYPLGITANFAMAVSFVAIYKPFGCGGDGRSVNRTC